MEENVKQGCKGRRIKACVKNPVLYCLLAYMKLHMWPTENWKDNNFKSTQLNDIDAGKKKLTD